MAKTTWSSTDWKSYSSTTSTKSTRDIFTSSSLHPDMNPMGLTHRECRDSVLFGDPTPIIVGADTTGSMSAVITQIVKKGLGTLVEETLSRKPVSDPQICFTAFDDIACFLGSPGSFQVGQFESDMKMTEWLEKIWLTGRGGGNNSESYILVPYFALYHVVSDAWEKRNKKGYIFTFGDECPSDPLTPDDVKNIFGSSHIERATTYKEMVEMVSKQWNYYHIIIGEGSYAGSYKERVINEWSDILGQNVMFLQDHTKLSELIVSQLEICNGRELNDVVGSWSGSTALTIKNAYINGAMVGNSLSTASSVVRL